MNFRRRHERARAVPPLYQPLARQIAVKEAQEKQLRDQMAMYQKRIEAVPTRESEMAELVAVAPPKITAMAISNASDDIQKFFLRCAKARVLAAIREGLETKVSLKEIGGARLKLVETARKLEREGFIRVKKIPV